MWIRRRGNGRSKRRGFGVEGARGRFMFCRGCDGLGFVLGEMWKYGKVSSRRRI